MLNRMTSKRYRWVSLAICLLAIALTALIVMELVPAFVGAMAFVGVAIWITVGVMASRSPFWSQARR